MFAVADEWPDYIPAALVGLLILGFLAVAAWDVVRESWGAKK